MTLSATKTIIRGSTVQWSTDFFDDDGAAVTPDQATVHIVYATADNNAEASVPMTAPATPGAKWTAIWDSRGATAPRTVYWSIHTGSGNPPPVSVEDGQFMLQANPANLLTF